MSKNNENSDALLNYVRVAYERLSAQQQNSGITKWVMLAAISYLVWIAIPNIQLIRDETNSWKTVALLCTHFIIIGISISGFYDQLKKNRHTSQYDRRQLVKPENIKLTIFCTRKISELGPLLISGTIALIYIAEISKAHFNYILLITIIYALSLISQTAIIVYTAQYQKKNGCMPAIFFSENKHSDLYTIIFDITLLLSSSYFLAGLLINYNGSIFTQITQTALAISAIGFIARGMIDTIGNEHSLSILLKLERDIVIHGLPPEKIKSRLEEEIIGTEIAEWARDRINEAKSKQNELDEYLNKVTEKIDAIKELDNSLVFEKLGRLSECTNELKSKSHALDTIMTKLLNWSSDYNKISKDPYILDVVDSIISELRDLFNKTKEKSEKTMCSIELLADEISAKQKR